MSTTTVLAQAATEGITGADLRLAAAFVGGGLALAGGAIGAANGNGTVGAATVSGIARQPEARGRLYGTMMLIVTLCEGLYFINVAFMLMFIFALS